MTDCVEAKEKVTGLEEQLASLKTAHALIENDLENIKRELSGIEAVKKDQDAKITDLLAKEDNLKKENKDMSEKLSNLKVSCFRASERFLQHCF